MKTAPRSRERAQHRELCQEPQPVPIPEPACMQWAAGGDHTALNSPGMHFPIPQCQIVPNHPHVWNESSQGAPCSKSSCHTPRGPTTAALLPGSPDVFLTKGSMLWVCLENQFSTGQPLKELHQNIRRASGPGRGQNPSGLTDCAGMMSRGRLCRFPAQRKGLPAIPCYLPLSNSVSWQLLQRTAGSGEQSPGLHLILSIKKRKQLCFCLLSSITLQEFHGRNFSFHSWRSRDAALGRAPGSGLTGAEGTMPSAEIFHSLIFLP